jgi:hypothetical protein
VPTPYCCRILARDLGIDNQARSPKLAIDWSNAALSDFLKAAVAPEILRSYRIDNKDGLLPGGRSDKCLQPFTRLEQIDQKFPFEFLDFVTARVGADAQRGYYRLSRVAYRNGDDAQTNFHFLVV